MPAWRSSLLHAPPRRQTHPAGWKGMETLIYLASQYLSFIFLAARSLLIYRSRHVDDDIFLRSGEPASRRDSSSFSISSPSPSFDLSVLFFPDLSSYTRFYSPSSKSLPVWEPPPPPPPLVDDRCVCWGAGPLIKYSPARLFDEFNEGRIHRNSRVATANPWFRD